MDISIEDLSNDLLIGNFSDVDRKSKSWLNSFSISEKNTVLYKRASEAYTYARFFLNRQDRIRLLVSDVQRARYFFDILAELNRIRIENRFEAVNNPLSEAMDLYVHARIAENYARAFAGQKSYNLDQNEIIQLAVSLLKLEKWKPAIESLDFLLRLNRHSAVVNFLIAYAFEKTGDKIGSHRHLREALFYKPEVLAEFPGFLAGEVFERIWRSLAMEGEKRDSIYREFALLLEINGIYKSPLELSAKDVLSYEKEFNAKLLQYEKTGRNPKELAEILHTLCWLIQTCNTKASYDKLDYYRQKMISLSPDTWETFHSKALA